MPTFTKDWVSSRVEDWNRVLGPFMDQPHVHGIEIGSFEGRSTLWFLENILTHSTSRIICIDRKKRRIFQENTRPHCKRLQVLVGPSQVLLRDQAFVPNSISFAYIDGDHDATAVLEDAVLLFRLIHPGGVMIFDDYLWMPLGVNDPLRGPQLGIDAFLSVYQGRYRLLYKNWQLAIEKIEPTRARVRSSLQSAVQRLLSERHSQRTKSASEDP